jgi:hypothetical protein
LIVLSGQPVEFARPLPIPLPIPRIWVRDGMADSGTQGLSKM